MKPRLHEILNFPSTLPGNVRGVKPMEPTDRRDWIRVRGARTHNLHNVSLDLPRGQLVVVTGPSGSGKSSLVFDTIFAEGQRRFLATLPSLPDSLHRQRPPVDVLEGLPPVLSVSQSAGAPRPRSTLATLTEIHDHLRLLWARRGTSYCPDCNRPIHQHTLAEVSRAVQAMPIGTKIYLLAPITSDELGDHREAFLRIRRGGFLRARVDGVLFEIRDPVPSVDPTKRHSIDLVVDRLVVRDGMADRLVESLTACVREGDGRIIISDVDTTGDWIDHVFSTRLSCPKCRRSIPELEPRRFHFNTPHGACPRCNGLGVIVSENADDHDASADDSLGEVCPECRGVRLNRDARAVRYAGLGDASITDVTALSATQALDRIRSAVIDANHPLADIERTLLAEIETRLRFLVEVGLGYLTLDRSAATLSGGELQRARLATQLGGGLRNVAFILDEPTLGLHPRDTRRLIASLSALQERGNSLIIVEHDEAVMRSADWLVDLGPGSGWEGGRILAQGPRDVVLADPESITARSFAAPTWPEPRPIDPARNLTLRGVRWHNLKNIHVSIPLGRLVAVTGVSGSGKSSLIHDVLARAVRKRLGLSTPTPGDHDAIDGLDHVARLIDADQRPIGRSSRSSAATYTGLFDEIRKLFARTRTAKIRGYSASRFSFNSRSGRCETCQGHGELRPEGPFLPDLTTLCPDCQGRRYNAGTLEVRFKGLSIADVLAMPVAEARVLFDGIAPVRRIVQALDDVGLGYLPLGQPATRLSGGEAQRIKLATEFAKAESGGALILLDEPTSGLHAVDIARLVSVLRRLVAAGNSIVVIEHHLGLIAACDWIIDLGPDAAERGGEVVATGPPSVLASNPASLTGRCLAESLSRSPSPSH